MLNTDSLNYLENILNEYVNLFFHSLNSDN